MAKTGISGFLRVFSGVFLFAALSCAVLWPIYPRLWQVNLCLAAALFVAELWLSRVRIGGALAKRTVRYGLNSIFMSILVLAIVVVINLIASKHDLKWDVSKNQVNTLSEQTVKVLKGLTQDIQFHLIVQPAEKSAYAALLDKYAYHSKHVIQDFVDADRDPVAISRFGVKGYGTIVVESKTRSAKIENLAGGVQDPKIEEKITNAIVQVEKGEKKKLYFVNGHGERLINDPSPEGFSETRDMLGVGRYVVEELNLLEKDKIPADAEILVIAGPRKDFMTHETTQLDAYVRGGGKVLWMLEPDSSKGLQPWLAKYGVAWTSGKAVAENDPRRRVQGSPIIPLIADYDSSSEITKDASQPGGTRPSIFAVATPVEVAAKLPEGIQVKSLLRTSPMSRESSLVANRLNVNDKTDRKGPLSLAVSVEGKADKKDYRMVVVGDANFGSNSIRNFGYNSDLLQNMLSWLAHEEDLISIRPKATDESHFDITEQRMRYIFFACTVLLPFAMLFCGIAVWLNRRRK